jgi:hypothetical protein
MSNKMNAIEQAIQEGKQLRIKYNGAVRIINPHLYGTNRLNEERLRATQIESNGVAHTADWKLFDVKKIEAVEMLETSVAVDPAYKNTDSVIVNIITKL